MANLAERTLTAWNLHWAGDHAQAERICREVLAADSSQANAWYLLATLAYAAGNIDSALELFQRADSLAPDRADLSSDFGIALVAAGRFEEAVTYLTKAVVRQPDNPQICVNLGNALRDLGRFDEALSFLQHAIDIQPDHVEAHWDRALTWLMMGDYVRGWPEFEWRLRLPNFEAFPQLGVPRWDGSSLDGKTILLFAEQGIGDTLQMIRYASVLKADGATVVICCRPSLAKLLHCCSGVDQVVTQGDPIPRLDFWLPLMSVPANLRPLTNKIPAEIPYFQPLPDLVKLWRHELITHSGGADRFHIGISWQGQPRYRDNRFRSFPLEQLAPLAQIPNVTLVNLQKGPGSEQLAGAKFPVLDFGSRLDETTGPFMDTAALIRCLDLVIAPNTGVVHLAGALGAKTWLPLSVYPDWRWGLTGDNSPWYPTMRLFRQEKLGQWDAVFGSMATALAAEF